MKKILIQPNSNLKNALKLMSETSEKCLVVVDKKNKLLGTLSDGDVRRAILNRKINIHDRKHSYRGYWRGQYG